MAARAEYVALEPIIVNGVHAYGEGDDVYQSAVDNLGLVVGEQVAPKGQKLLAKPAKNASRAAWAAYALDQGINVEDVDGMGRDELIDFFEEDDGAAVGPE